MFTRSDFLLKIAGAAAHDNMAMESSIFPVPSEIVIPPAAFLASEGKLNTFGVIAAGTFGSWLGATVTYWAALWLGRVFIGRWGRYFLLSEHKLERAENWVRRYEAGGIFFARLLPVIRHDSGQLVSRFGELSFVLHFDENVRIAFGAEIFLKRRQRHHHNRIETE